MIQINEDFLQDIEEKLLPKGAKFSSQQKNVIKCSETVNIIAGPGSGKTTVLTAKCAMLLNENISNKKGICLITHTNVAVDEIKDGLYTLGFEQIEHPHFIGTIQEFFNYFFARKAFHLLLGDKKMRVLEEDEYRERFDNNFNRLKPENYNANNPNPKYKNHKLLINNDLSINVTSDAPNFYKDAFNWSIERLVNTGILTNEQCLELAAWYINKYQVKIKNAIKNRFNYVLLDEAQDTNNIQYNLLNQVFLNNVVFQRFGDPYQALYSIFSNEEDSWMPSNEPLINKLDISETSRFNENIAKYVRGVCVEKYDKFKSISNNNSAPPYFISYENGDELLSKYRKLINKIKEDCSEFSKSNRKDAILSVKHDDLTGIFDIYKKDKLKIKKSESIIYQMYQSILRIISREMDITIKEADDKVNSSLKIKRKIATDINAILKPNSEIPIDSLLNIIENITNSTIAPKRKTELKDRLSKYKLDKTTMYDIKQINTEEFYIGTVHSVKGETHRSTLLILNTVFSDFSNTYSYEITELLENYLLGNYLPLNNIFDSIKKRETKKALKLAYVAFSRPSHLVAIAIHNNNLNDDLRKSLLEAGWLEGL